jgi:hypothetical protein
VTGGRFRKIGQDPQPGRECPLTDGLAKAPKGDVDVLAGHQRHVARRLRARLNVDIVRCADAAASNFSANGTSWTI